MCSTYNIPETSANTYFLSKCSLLRKRIAAAFLVRRVYTMLIHVLPNSFIHWTAKLLHTINIPRWVCTPSWACLQMLTAGNGCLFGSVNKSSSSGKASAKCVTNTHTHGVYTKRLRQQTCCTARGCLVTCRRAEQSSIATCCAVPSLFLSPITKPSCCTWQPIGLQLPYKSRLKEERDSKK